MANIENLKKDVGNLKAAAEGFLPPAWSAALSVLPTIFSIIGNLIDGEEVEWKDVDWQRFKLTVNTVEFLQKHGHEITEDEIKEIMGVG